MRHDENSRPTGLADTLELVGRVALVALRRGVGFSVGPNWEPSSASVEKPYDRVPVLVFIVPKTWRDQRGAAHS